jgi:hypothetical protein
MISSFIQFPANNIISFFIHSYLQYYSFFLRIVFAIQSFLCFHMNFRLDFSIFVKNDIGILMELHWIFTLLLVQYLLWGSMYMGGFCFVLVFFCLCWVFSFFYCFIIHMCIQCLGNFSPLPPPPPLPPTLPRPSPPHPLNTQQKLFCPYF